MTEQQEQHKKVKKGMSPSAVLVIVGIALALFAVFMLKSTAQTESPAAAAAVAGTAGSADGGSVARNDAVSDYQAALKSGKPIYVLFHSLTCQPCVEIDAVADEVVPEYEDRVTFVDAITGDPDGQQLASRFSFQYIPTSFFLKADGKVVDSYTGVLTADEMRARLDALLAAK